MCLFSHPTPPIAIAKQISADMEYTANPVHHVKGLNDLISHEQEIEVSGIGDDSGGTEVWRRNKFCTKLKGHGGEVFPSR